MLSKKTERLVEKLVHEAAGAALRVYRAGGSAPDELEALASLITAVRDDLPADSSPCIGFALPALEDDA